ncbi:hypothetical protein NW762_008896 [Fusarium torreyae]|uniref:VOC domain-containing protein n=1 Tax=Fusarium torreyae TaxID=1237075 RepID=A0A9W8VF59_9HYPO|nr:hypothetical protein NW762_008896 [Fusarium torreyae]
MRMKFASLVVILGTALVSTAAQPQNETTAPAFVPGTDKPSDPATTGYFLNKVGISVSNLTRSVDFYTKVFGFRHMFTFQATPHFSVTYLGHSSGGRNGTGYQTAEEMIRNKNNMAGQLSLIHLKAPDEPQLQGTNTFRHIIGIIVPDITEAQARLEKYGAEIFRKIEEPMPTTGPLGNPYGFGDAADLSTKDWEAIQNVMTKINLEGVFAADPDGNLLKVLPAEEKALIIDGGLS